MSKPSDRKRAKHDKRRADARRRARAQALPTDVADLVALAATKPFGSCWISLFYQGKSSDGGPPFVTVVVTRRLRGDLLLPAMVVVDRSCLGVKRGSLMRIGKASAVEHDIKAWGAAMGEPLVPCDALLAQSIVFHAIDYARSLGFTPPPGAPIALFEPRPAALLDTLHCRPPRPFYREEREDDAPSILGRLDEAVGPDDYEYSPVDDDFDDDEGEIMDGMLRVDREPVMPVRLYYDVADAERLRAELEALRADAADELLPFAKIAVTDTRTLTLESPSHAHATGAANLVHDVFALRPSRARVVNRCFEEDEGTPEELAQWLDRDASEPPPDDDDVPLVEDLELLDKDGSPLGDLGYALMVREIRAMRHWDGDTDVTAGSVARALAEHTASFDALLQ